MESLEEEDPLPVDLTFEEAELYGEIVNALDQHGIVDSALRDAIIAQALQLLLLRECSI